MHDLVIRNARIIDGLGNPSQHGAIAVNGGRISEVGDEVGRGREIVDADGLALSPGIVDIHTHYDAQLTWDPWATPSVGLGVTTVVLAGDGLDEGLADHRFRRAIGGLLRGGGGEAAEEQQGEEHATP